MEKVRKTSVICAGAAPSRVDILMSIPFNLASRPKTFHFSKERSRISFFSIRFQKLRSDGNVLVQEEFIIHPNRKIGPGDHARWALPT